MNKNQFSFYVGSRELRGLIEKYALQNAVKYNTSPKVGAVMRKLVGEHPELRSYAREITDLVEAVVDEVSKLSADERSERLAEVAPLEGRKREEPEKGLPPLKADKIVMRFAPNPNGPPTLGSARGIIINSAYVKKYDGKFILRFDDTDPVTKRPMLEAYDWYLDACDWLDAAPDEVIIASDRVEKYYGYAKKLIKIGGAYVCFCSRTDFKAYKEREKPCPHRNRDSEDDLEAWQGMLDGLYGEGEAVLRVKTGMSLQDPALRDWVAFRIIETDHPRVGNRYRVWPTLDFESAIEDRLLGTTHIIRGKDMMDSEHRQRYIYNHFGWEYPETIRWGRIKILEFGDLSTSSLREGVESGKYKGWDDPKLPTLLSLRKRGINPYAIRKFMLDLGINEVDINLSLVNLYAENRKILDPKANRYFFVWDPIPMELENLSPTKVKAPLNPNRDDYRVIPVEDGVYVCRDDVKHLSEGEKIRLKDFCNVTITSLDPLKAEYIGDDLSEIRRENGKIIHWTPVDAVRTTVMSPDSQIDGVSERNVVSETGQVVQFERFGFVKVYSADDKVVAYFAHK